VNFVAPPVKVVAPPSSPCGTVAPARKYDAKEAAFVQQVAAPTKRSAMPAWAFPLFGVVGMLSFAAGFGVVRSRRSNASTRTFQPAHMEEMDEESLLDTVLE